MKNFNDVINSVGEAINNAAQSGNIEEMNPTCCFKLPKASVQDLTFR